MRVFNFIKKEFSGWGRTERFIMPLVILLIIGIAIYKKDSVIAIIYAFCGICATVLAGKGKISCYFFGMVANLCYSYISYKNMFWGHLALNMLYYFPMQFVGIAKWKNHLKKDTQEIYKSALSLKGAIICSLLAIMFSSAGYFVLKLYNDSNPAIDSVTTVLSVMAFILTVKRCIEQWYVWTIVNGLCIIMWIGAYMHGAHCFAIILMWTSYLVLGLYFLYNWKKELNKN